MAFVNKVNGIPIDDFLAVNLDYTKVPALDKYGNPYLFEDGTPQYTVIPKSDEEVPTVDPFSGQQVSTLDQLKYDPNDENIFSKFVREYEDAHPYLEKNGKHNPAQMKEIFDAYNKFINQSTPEVPTIDPFSGQPVEEEFTLPDISFLSPSEQESTLRAFDQAKNPSQSGPTPPINYYYDEVPTIDPFSGQQVSMQDQMAFAQPQADIFPEQSRGLDYLTGMPDSQPVSQLGRQGILNLLTSNFGDLDFQTINELRNNPDAFNLSRGYGALTAGSLLPKFIKDFQYAAPQGTDINQLRNLARETASNKSFTDLIKDVYNDPAKFDPDFKPKAGQIKTGYPQYLKEGILSAVGFQPTSQIGGGTDAARALLEKIKSIPGAQTLGKVLPGVGIASGTYDVGSRLSQGDYFGAGLGALSAVPFVGIPAAAAQAAYDYRQPLADMIRNVVYRPGRG